MFTTPLFAVNGPVFVIGILVLFIGYKILVATPIWVSKQIMIREELFIE